MQQGTPIMFYGDIAIMPHAVYRLTERLCKNNPTCLKDPLHFLIQLFQRAKTEKGSIGRFFARNQRHGDTEFLATPDGWRLVIAVNDEGERTLVTVERIKRGQN